MRGTNKHKKLCSFERDLIGVFLSSGESISQIARSLGRSKSTISDEIRRNSIRNIYLPSQAEDITRYRREKASKKRIKLLKDPKLYSYVMSKLKDDHWSPEEIEGRIEREFINSKSMRISYETIYRFIYRMNNLSLWNYLPRKHKKRKKQNRLIREGKDKIPERISIHERPEKIENRIEFGHFEGDSVIGKRYGSGLHTEVERISRRLFTEKIGRVNSEETIKAQISMFSC
jgi:IS30 family transposase